MAAELGKPLTRLMLGELTSERVLDFLLWLEAERGNSPRTRNQRLAALRGFFRYAATRCPEVLAEAQRVEAIPTKRCPPGGTTFLERDELDVLFAQLPAEGPLALRDRALLTFLYSSGARAREAADLCVGDVDWDEPCRVRLHGKGDKSRWCPLWPETVALLRRAVGRRGGDAAAPLFLSRTGRHLTRFGIHKIVRRNAGARDRTGPDRRRGNVSPHVFRHTTAFHLLEAGVELNLIAGWLGHASLDSTHRYAEISLRAKIAAVEKCMEAVDGEGTKKAVGSWK